MMRRATQPIRFSKEAFFTELLGLPDGIITSFLRG